MKINKLFGVLMASVMSLSAVSIIPAEYNDFVISASAYTKKEILVISKDVDHISKEMYANTNYKKIVFEGDISYIDEEAFSTCPLLEEIEFNGNVASPKGKGGIEDYAFAYCYNLKKVTFKKKDATVDKIGDSAFYFCPKLESINIPTNTKTIDRDAFLNCSRLTSVTIPEKTTIGEHAFGYVYYTGSKEYEKSNGKTVIYYSYTIDDEQYSDSSTAHPVKLKVVAGSPAEKYAKDNKLSYTKYTPGSTANAKTKLPAPKNFKASSVTENSITLSWKAVEGAAKYKVYKFNPETGKYAVYKTTSKTKLTVSKLDSGTKYKFMVVAYREVDGKLIKGTSSKALSVTTL